MATVALGGEFASLAPPCGDAPCPGLLSGAALSAEPASGEGEASEEASADVSTDVPAPLELPRCKIEHAMKVIATPTTIKRPSTRRNGAPRAAIVPLRPSVAAESLIVHWLNSIGWPQA